MEFLEKFGVDPLLLLAQIVNFTILLLLLKLFLYKPILKILEERKKKVEHSIKSAEAIERKLAKVEEEQQKFLDQAKNEANKIIAEAKSEAKELTEKTITQTRQTAEEILTKNEQHLKLEKEAMLLEVKKELADLVAVATAKVVGKSLNEKDNQEIINQTLKELVEK